MTKSVQFACCMQLEWNISPLLGVGGNCGTFKICVALQPSGDHGSSDCWKGKGVAFYWVHIFNMTIAVFIYQTTSCHHHRPNFFCSPLHFMPPSLTLCRCAFINTYSTYWLRNAIKNCDSSLTQWDVILSILRSSVLLLYRYCQRTIIYSHFSSSFSYFLFLVISVLAVFATERRI